MKYAPELCIIKLFLLDKESFEIYYSQIKEMNFEPEIKSIFKTISSYYVTYPTHIYVSKDEFKLYYDTLFSMSKNKEMIHLLIDTIYSIEISSSIIKDIIRHLIEKEVSLSIISKLTPVIAEDKFGILSTISDELARYDLLLDKQDDSSLFVSSDLEELIKESEKKGILKWRLQCLQQDLGNIQGGILGHVFARPECYSADTEVLTPLGWKRFDLLKYTDKIASINEYREINFEIPSHIECHHETNMYYIHDTMGRVSLHVSANHNLVYENSKGILVKQTAEQIKYDQNKKHHTAGFCLGSSLFTAFDALQIAYQADGHTRSYKEYGYTFSLKKERKIKRLENILKELKYPYTKYKDGNKGNIGFYIKTDKPLYKNFNWINLETMSLSYAEDFIEELSYWDCTRRTSNRYKFDTTNKEVANTIQAITSLANYNCCLSVFKDDRKETYKDIYSLSIRTKYKPIGGASIIKERLSYSDNVYCATVSTGMLLVRHNNCVSVCGNCGKTSFLASEITYIAQQLQEDETILWCNNEQRGDKVVTRLYSAMLNESDERVINNITKAKELFYKMGGPKIKLYDNGFISMEHIRSMIKVYEPKMVIIDQGDKIMFQGGLKLEGHARLKELYRLFRETAKEFNTHILTVGQASAEASGKKWLEMHHLDNSRTGKPGEMDYIIGIGKTMADEDEELRYINLCKNKLTGRHSKHTLRFNGLTGRYSDL